MKRIHVIIRDETYQQLLFLKENRGMTFSGSIKVALDDLVGRADGKVRAGKRKKAVDMDPRVAKDLEKYKSGEDAFCPVCGLIALSCGHLEDGSIIRRLEQHYGILPEKSGLTDG